LKTTNERLDKMTEDVEFQEKANKSLIYENKDLQNRLKLIEEKYVTMNKD
jgi:hypothetical protein